MVFLPCGEMLNIWYRKLAQDPHNTQVLEEFWTAHRQKDSENSPKSGLENGPPSGERADREQSHPLSNGQPRKRNRAVSTGSALAPPGQPLSSHHPALSLPTLLDTFGPLIFPLYKTALLRKRILLIGHAPVELACDFGKLDYVLQLLLTDKSTTVYNISVLSNIPASVSNLLPLEPLPIRIRPLFSVGVHDIPTLSQGSSGVNKPIEDARNDDSGYGWIGCTTDDILATKDNLFDALVTIPPSYTKQAKEKVWPRIKIIRGTEVRATQRDLRRYRTLRRQLQRCRSKGHARSPFSFSKATTSEEEDPNTTLPIENTQETFDDASSTSDEKLVEPQSWSALAYSSFLWWASAGEKRTDLEEEAEYDNALLRDLDRFRDASPDRPRSARSPMMSSGFGDSDSGLEMTVIAYFHRFTALILGTLSEIVDGSDAAEEEQQADEDDSTSKDNVIFIASEDMTRMGLDVWSEGDRRFVKDLVELYWGREADVQGARVECCGVRIC